MASAATIDVMLRANTASYRAAMLQAGRATNAALGGIRREVAATSRSVQTLNRVAAGFLSVQALRVAGTHLARIADEYSNIQAKLRLVTGDQVQLGRAMDQVFAISQRTYTSLDATATLVARTTRALVSSGTATDQALAKSLKLSEAINNAFLVSGATNTEAQNAIIQLSQGLAAGALRGEEFNSVAEQGSRITQALSEYLGVTTGELRKMAKDGKLTADVVSGALLSSFEKLRAEAELMPLTIGRAKTQLDNAFTQYIGQADQAFGSSRKVAEGIQFVARNLDPLVGAFITVTKVAAAYFAVYRVGIPLVTATIALQRKLTQEIIATSIAQELGIKTATSWATRMRAAVGVALSAFTGFQIGSYMRDQFLEVEIAGIALVSGLMQGWERAKGSAKIAALAIEAYFKKAFQAGQNFAAGMVGLSADAIEAMDQLGISGGVVARMRAAEDRMRATGDAWTEFKLKAGETALATAAAVAKIDRDFSDLAEAATRARLEGKELEDAFADFELDSPDFSVVIEGAKDAADQLQRLMDARAAFQRDSDRMKAEFEGPSAVAWHEYATAVQDAAQAVGRGEATVAQFIEREALLGRQLRETNEEIAARKTPMEQLLADLAFEQKLMAMGNAERAAAIQLRGMEAEEIRKYGAAVLEANQQILEAQKRAAGQDFFRETTKRLFVDAVSGAKSAKDAVNDFFDTLRQRALEALAERLMDQLFGQQGTTQGGAAGSNWASWIGQLFSYDKGGYTGAGGKTDPAGVVHKGEVVWSQADISRAGGVGVVEAMRRGLRGYADGGWVSGSDLVAMKRPADEGTMLKPRRGITIGGDKIIIQGATSKRTLQALDIEKSRRMRRAVREFG